MTLKPQAHEGCEGLHTGEVNTGSTGEEEFQAEKTERELGQSLGGEVLFGPADQRAGWGCSGGVKKRHPQKSFINGLLLSWVKRI